MYFHYFVSSKLGKVSGIFMVRPPENLIFGILPGKKKGEVSGRKMSVGNGEFNMCSPEMCLKSHPGRA